MLTGLFAAALAFQTRASTFQKTPGGAAISVESEPGKTFALCLAFRVPASMAPWQAHMLEHVLVAGKDGTLPARLQTYDIRIQGVTTRSQMNILLDGPSSELPAALVALGEILDTRPPADPSREITVLREERALRPTSDRFTDEVYATVPVGPLFPGEDATPPEKPREAILVQSGAAVALVADTDPKPLADSLLRTLSVLPAGPRTWPETKLPPFAMTPKAFGVRIGPAGTPGMLAGAAAAVALSGRDGSQCVVDTEAGASFAVVTGGGPTAQALDDACAAAPVVARALAARWSSDSPTWVQFKAATLLAGLRMKRSDLGGLAKDLRPSDYLNALEPLRP